MDTVIKDIFCGFRKGTKEFNLDLGSVVNSIILIVVYIFGIGFSSFIAKILRKQLFEPRPAKQKKSYWIDSVLHDRGSGRFYQQF